MVIMGVAIPVVLVTDKMSARTTNACASPTAMENNAGVTDAADNAESVQDRTHVRISNASVSPIVGANSVEVTAVAEAVGIVAPISASVINARSCAHATNKVTGAGHPEVTASHVPIRARMRTAPNKTIASETVNGSTAITPAK